MTRILNPDFPIPIAWDSLWVPQGAEFRAVQKGCVASPRSIFSLALPVGDRPVTTYLETWWQSPDRIKPQGVIVLGLAGSLDPTVGVGQGILYHTCYHPAEQREYQTDPVLTQALAAYFAQTLPLVRSLAGDRVITHAQEKHRLGQAYQAQVVDMESAAILRFCQHHQIPVAILRVVSDEVDQTLPDLSQVYTPKGELKSLALAIALLQKPRAGLDLIQGSLTALRKLTDITRALNQIPYPSQIRR